MLHLPYPFFHQWTFRLLPFLGYCKQHCTEHWHACILKLLEENTGRMLSDMNHGNIFLNPSPRIMEIKTKINKYYLLKIKSFCLAKETITKKDNPQIGRK